MPERVAQDRRGVAPGALDGAVRGPRRKATERPFSGEHLDSKQTGTYRCAGCGTELFRSDAKFESGTGWPSFYEPASENAVATEEDASHGMTRTEVLCASCEGHLGHVFPDGPVPDGAALLHQLGGARARAGRETASRPAARRRASALSVRSQVKSWSSRPKWP